MDEGRSLAGRREGGVLAIDYGDRKSGFASADALRIAVAPLGALRLHGDGQELLEAIAGLLAERSVATLLVGLPYHSDGSEGERARVTRAFVRRLEARFPKLEVVLHDERLTTKEAESLLLERGHSGREIARQRDSWSALVLLRDWIASGEPRPENPG